MKFKIGDKVKSTWDNIRGEIGEIVKKHPKDDNCYIVKGFSAGMEFGKYHTYRVEFLELVGKPQLHKYIVLWEVRGLWRPIREVLYPKRSRGKGIGVGGK